MKIQSKYFGMIDYEPEEILHFSSGIPGFEQEKQFLLLPFADSGSAMFSLQSVGTPQLAFVLFDPFLLTDYEPRLQPEELSQLGADHEEQLCFYVMCATKNPVSDSTVNLRCPIVINPHSLEARQILLETDRYEMRCPLSSLEQPGGATC